jgi:hypothetical protein
MAQLTRSQLLEQARIAEQYARSRPAPDIRGYVEAMFDARHFRALAEAKFDNPPKHRFWGAGEPDCPREIKAGNGELHTLRCKACGLDNPRDEICREQVPA